MADHCRISNASLFHPRVANDHWHPHSGFVERRLGSWKSHAMVAGKYHDRIVEQFQFFQNFGQAAKALINPGNALVVHGQLRSAGRSVWQKVRDHDLVRIVVDAFDTRIAFQTVSKGIGTVRQIAAFIATAMGIGSAEVQEERLIALPSDQMFLDVVGHLHGIPRIARQLPVELINGFWRHMILTDPQGIVARLGQANRQTAYTIKG